MKGIFGPRGPSYSYYANNQTAPFYVTPSYVAPSLTPYLSSSYAYTQYPNTALYPTSSQFLYTGQFQNSTQNISSYGLGKPEIFLPSQGLESVLIAILILVVLDMVFVRPLKNSTP